MNCDVMVLGSGPAGLAAAAALRGRNRDVLVIGAPWQDSPLARAERIDNYMGLPGLSGRELLERFYDHAQRLGVRFLTGRAVSLMTWDGFALTAGSQVCRSAALILAPGVVRQAKLPGEQEFLGRGVSYCATCDGMLYRGRKVVVAGLSKDAPQEANYLKSLGCQVVYVSPSPPEGLDGEIPQIQAGRLEIKGEKTVAALTADGRDISCQGVFVLRQAVAPADLLPQLKTQEGAIVVDRSMATSVPGVFAAGDCTGGPFQVAKAVGEGHIAGLSAAEYVEQQKKIS